MREVGLKLILITRTSHQKYGPTCSLLENFYVQGSGCRLRDLLLDVPSFCSQSKVLEGARPLFVVPVDVEH